MSDSDEDPGFETAEPEDTHPVDVKLMDGRVIKDFLVFLDNTVLGEKTKIWTQENQMGPPELADVVLVLIGPHGGQKLMDDNKRVGDYLDDLLNSSIEFKLKGQS